MHNILYKVLAMILVFIFNGCTVNSPKLIDKSVKTVAPYSLEALDKRYHTKGY